MNNKLNVICCYLPPSTGKLDGDLTRMNSFLHRIQPLLNCELPNYVVGDFNLRDIDWLSPNISGMLPDNLFAEFAVMNGLEQVVDGCTRGTSTLDLVLTDCREYISRVAITAPFSTGDHSMIWFDLTLNCGVPIPPACNRVDCLNNFALADWGAINLALSLINWRHLADRNTPIDISWLLFYDCIHAIINTYVPKMMCTRRNPKKIRYPKAIRKLRALKLAKWSALKLNSGDPALRASYKASASVLKKEIWQWHRDHETYLLSNMNQSTFFKYAKSRLKKKHDPMVLLHEGNIISSPIDVANLFNVYFASTFTPDNHFLPDFPLRCNEELNTILFDILSISKVIKQLKPSSSFGMDNIPNIFLKKSVTSITLPLSFLFERSMSSNYIPPIWKAAKIIPILKKGSSTDASNYRPISLISSISKVMERVIVNQMLDFLHAHQLITPAQYGFQHGSSTIIQLIECHSAWLTSQNKGDATDVIYLDYAKAFDSVIHAKLLLKLAAYGIHNDLLIWFTNFLNGRTQAVMIDGSLSYFLPVTSGVPQGSVCGPLLFLIYINDLPTQLPSSVKCYLFADDAKISKVIKSITDCMLLQKALLSISSWSDSWQLTLSIPKCIVQHFGRANPAFTYHLSGVSLISCDYVRDLGITVSNDLKYHRHFANIISAAAKKLFLLSKCFHSKCPAVLKLAHTAFIRPSLEYGSVIWNPWSASEVNCLEKTQRKLLSRAFGSDTSYEQQLRAINLPSLKARRDYLDLAMYRVILTSSSRIDPSSLFVRNTRESRHMNKLSLVMPLCHTSAYRHSFQVRAIETWNHLPDDFLYLTSSFASNIINYLSIIN